MSELSSDSYVTIDAAAENATGYGVSLAFSSLSVGASQAQSLQLQQQPWRERNALVAAYISQNFPNLSRHIRFRDLSAIQNGLPDPVRETVSFGAILCGERLDVAFVSQLAARLMSFGWLGVLSQSDTTYADTFIGSLLSDWQHVDLSPSVRYWRSTVHWEQQTPLQLILTSTDGVTGVSTRVLVSVPLPQPPLTNEQLALQELNALIAQCRNSSSGADGKDAGSRIIEGHVAQSPWKIRALRDVARNMALVESVCEIGFNVGHSTVIWLENNPNARLLSFDYCQNSCSQQVLLWMQRRYGKRFTAICGDSTQTVPAFAQSHVAYTCDVVHIDGGHEGDTPLLDLYHMAPLANPLCHTLVMDDTGCSAAYCVDPQRAWDRLNARVQLCSDGALWVITAITARALAVRNHVLTCLQSLVGVHGVRRVK